MVSQGAHASMKVILEMMSRQMMLTSPYGDTADVEVRSLTLPNGSALQDWLRGKFTKITCSVDSERELLELYEKADLLRIPCTLITDAGLTEFGGTPTHTAIAIGPAWEDEVDPITSHLKLL